MVDIVRKLFLDSNLFLLLPQRSLVSYVSIPYRLLPLAVELDNVIGDGSELVAAELLCLVE